MGLLQQIQVIVMVKNCYCRLGNVTDISVAVSKTATEKAVAKGYSGGRSGG